MECGIDQETLNHLNQDFANFVALKIFHQLAQLTSDPAAYKKEMIDDWRTVARSQVEHFVGNTFADLNEILDSDEVEEEDKKEVLEHFEESGMENKRLKAIESINEFHKMNLEYWLRDDTNSSDS